MRIRRGWIAVPVFALVLFAGGRRLGPAPAIGVFLDPVRGAWAVTRSASLPDRAAAAIPGLADSVRVIYDDRAVPHIFATTEADAYRALGYVVARDRLFQLELQTRAAAGTLTEVVGASQLDADRATRALGMPRAAEAKLAALDSTDSGFLAMVAYADGVNAWIDGLDHGDVPIEFHLLGARPARWKPIDSVHLLNRMGWTLSYGEEELSRLEARARVGVVAADALYPAESPIQEPIQPTGLGRPRVALRRLPPPGAPDTAAAALARVTASLAPTWRRRDFADGDAVGSNNWAVAPRRTAAGHVLLAGDPHLDLTLPSIWYEAHLVVPGVLDVYGITIPGAPGIIIGFNRDVAWTFTNTQADVVDYFSETVDDPAAPLRYLLDSAWVPLELRVEHYVGPDGGVIAIDTVRYTHRGPLRRVPALGASGRTSRNEWVSMRWTLLDPSRETSAFIDIMRSRSVADWMAAMAAYRVPAQNMLVADRAGTIAIRSTGTFPRRGGDGRGDVILDGSRRASDWTGAWPVAMYPQSVNPAQGFLASANQQPVDPTVNPAYLGTGWFPPWRAMRINSLLRADSAVTPDAMRRYQTDPGSPRADAFVPVFLASARRAGGWAPLDSAARLLAQWNRQYSPDNERAVLFEYAMDELGCSVWDELLSCGRTRRGGPRPDDVVLLELLADSASVWWDVRETPNIETRDEIVGNSLARAFTRAIDRHGPPTQGGWRWSSIRQVNVAHLAGIPAFSAAPVPALGGPSTLSPSSGSGTHGASWRMVVELGPEVRAWATYPGGQSGNPLSDRYADRLPTWAAGELDTLRFPKSAGDLGSTGVRGMLVLSAKR